jgi:hypothetical protein
MEEKEVQSETGFFVKVREDFYTGPFDTLNDARSDARKVGPDLKIYHGVLKQISEGVFDDSQLFLIPKCQKDF